MNKVTPRPPRLAVPVAGTPAPSPAVTETKAAVAAEPGFVAKTNKAPVALQAADVAKPTETTRAERVQTLFNYARTHQPGRVDLPGVPEAPAMPGKRLLVVNKGPNLGAPGESSIMVMDLTSGKLLKKFNTEPGPHEVMVAPDGKTAVAPNYGLQTQGTGIETGGGNSLTVVDLQAEAVRTLTLEGWFRPHGVEWLDSQRVAVTVDGKGTDLSSGYVLEVNVKTGEVERAHKTGEPGTHLVRASPDGKYLFCSNIQGGSFSRIDRATGEVKTLETGKGTEGFDFTPDGQEIWTGNLEESTFSIIDVASFSVKQTLKSPGELPIRFKFVSPNLLLVANRGSNDVSFIDPRTQQPVGKQLTFDLARFEANGPNLERTSVPMQLELSADKRFAFVGNSHSGLVSMIDISKREVVGYYLAGDKPDPLALYDAPPAAAAVRASHLQLGDELFRLGLRPKQVLLAPVEAGKPALEPVTVKDNQGRPTLAVVIRTSSAAERQAAERTAATWNATVKPVDTVPPSTPVAANVDTSQRAIFTRAMGLADRVLKNAGLDPNATDRQMYRYAMARFLLNGTSDQGLAWLEKEWKGSNADLLASGQFTDRWRIKIERELEAPYLNGDVFNALVDLNGRVTTALAALRGKFPNADMQFYVAGSPTKGRLGASSDIDLMISTKDTAALKAALDKSYMTAPDPKEIFDIGEYEEFVRRGKYFGVPVGIGDGKAALETKGFLTKFYVDETKKSWGLTVDAANPNGTPLEYSNDVIEKFVREAPMESETLFSAARAYRRHVDISFVAKYLERLDELQGISEFPADRLADYGEEVLAERANGKPVDLSNPLAAADALGITDLRERLTVEFAAARRVTQAATKKN